VIAAERLDHQLGPICELTELTGDVVLLGTYHSSNTTIHLAEQQMGRGRFYRYARDGTGLWVELANVTGASHRLDNIEHELRSATVETRIGNCRARKVPIADVLATTRAHHRQRPCGLACDDEDCRCVAATTVARNAVRSQVADQGSARFAGR
jgi:aminoglycoside 3-N-acetyltransferase